MLFFLNCFVCHLTESYLQYNIWLFVIYITRYKLYLFWLFGFVLHCSSSLSMIIRLFCFILFLFNFCSNFFSWLVGNHSLLKPYAVSLQIWKASYEEAFLTEIGTSSREPLHSVFIKKGDRSLDTLEPTHLCRGKSSSLLDLTASICEMSFVGIAFMAW